MSSSRRFATIVAAAAAALLLPAIVAAHPLGNFTINHYAGLRIAADRIALDVVIDQAEIPTFQERSRIDTDGDGTVSAGRSRRRAARGVSAARGEPVTRRRLRSARADARRSGARLSHGGERRPHDAARLRVHG